MICTFKVNLSRLFLSVVMVALFTLAGGGTAFAWEGPLLIDHNCADLSNIPSMWIEAAMNNTRLYYAHTSHGMQITEGLRLVEERDPFFAYEMATRQLPADTASLCVNDDYMANPYNYFLDSGLDRRELCWTTIPISIIRCSCGVTSLMSGR